MGAVSYVRCFVFLSQKQCLAKEPGVSVAPLVFLFLFLGTKFLEIITTKYIITKRNGLWSEKTIDGLDGSGLLKIYAFSMEDKMAAGAFGRARNYGWNVPQSTIRIYYKSLIDHDPLSLLFFLKGICHTKKISQFTFLLFMLISDPASRFDEGRTIQTTYLVYHYQLQLKPNV